MRKYILPFLILLFLSFPIIPQEKGIKIEWVNTLDGDFSFSQQWDYTDYVYKNDYGQLICDAICHPDTENMMDERGKIFEDSLHRYYQLVDTTHLYSSIECEASVYGWAGTNHLVLNKTDDKTFEANTLCRGGTYSSLYLILKNDTCIPTVKFFSPAGTEGTEYFRCKKGYIKIDKTLLDKDILKAEFDFSFDDPYNKDKNIYWRGKILSQIN